jgi:hypothetical protein
MNAQHYEFMDVFITVLVEAGFTAAKITALLSQQQTAFSEEDRWYMIARASEIIALREAADKRRDNFYGRVHAIIKAWAGSGVAEMEAAATMLKKIFDIYKVNTSAQIDAESGQLDNLITDLSTADMQTALQTLGIKPLYQQMVTAHQETKSYRLEQGAEESEKVRGALRNARKECDRLYDELTYLIEAFAKTADNPEPYEAFIRKWNGTLKIYQDMLDRKSGSSAGGTANPDGTGEKPNTNQNENGGGSNENNNENENQGGGTNTPETPGGDTPDPGTGGGTSPDPSQGGDNNSGGGPDENGGYNND